MAKDLKEALVTPEAKLGGAEKPHMNLGTHLEYIESLLEQGAGGAEKPHMNLGTHLEYIESLLEQGAGGADGKSIPPTLNLFDLDSDDSIVRTTITEEEKTNLENGLYNQVIFPGLIPDEHQLFMPSKIIGDKLFDVNTFVQFNCVISGDTATINALSVYSYSFGEKDTNGNYPITITKEFDIPIGSSGGGESVSPTLVLIDLTQGEPRTTITEQEKNNLEKGLYSQILYASEEDPNTIYSISHILKLGTSLGFGFVLIDGSVENGEQINFTTMSLYSIQIGEKNARGEYPITIQKIQSFGLGNLGGSSEIPTLSTMAPSMSDLTTTIYSDADIALIKKQKDNFIKVPFGTTDNNASELCYVFSFNDVYSLIDVAGTILSFTNAFAEAPNFLYFDLNETDKKLTIVSYSSLSVAETSLYVESAENKLFLTDQLTTSEPVNVNNKAYYFDKINGKSIIHEENIINNYTIPTITFED